MSRTRWLAGLVLAALSLVPVALEAGEEAAGKPSKETFTARVVRQGGPGGGAYNLFITIERWATPEERQQLLDTLMKEGPKAAQKVLGKMDSGYVRAPNTKGWRINYAISVPTEQGRLVRLVTERPLAFFENIERTRSADYELGIVEFVLDDRGEGAGVMLPAAQITVTKQGEVEVESLGTGPHQLVRVKKD